MNDLNTQEQIDKLLARVAKLESGTLKPIGINLDTGKVVVAKSYATFYEDKIKRLEEELTIKDKEIEILETSQKKWCNKASSRLSEIAKLEDDLAHQKANAERWAESANQRLSRVFRYEAHVKHLENEAKKLSDELASSKLDKRELAGIAFERKVEINKLKKECDRLTESRYSWCAAIASDRKSKADAQQLKINSLKKECKKAILKGSEDERTKIIKRLRAYGYNETADLIEEEFHYLPPSTDDWKTFGKRAPFKGQLIEAKKSGSPGLYIGKYRRNLGSVHAMEHVNEMFFNTDIWRLA